jgi:hypothetical protein
MRKKCTSFVVNIEVIIVVIKFQSFCLDDKNLQGFKAKMFSKQRKYDLLVMIVKISEIRSNNKFVF